MTSKKVENIEALWSGTFGDEYVQRNLKAYEGREPFWRDTLALTKPTSVLEVGCNVGGNLRWIKDHVPARNVVGVDINETALRTVRQGMPDVNALWSPAKDLPFRDGAFDLVFTTGVLIHQPPEDLPQVMDEIVRVARRFVLAGECYAKEPTEVTYRGLTGAFWKCDFGGIYKQRHPGLTLAKTGFLAKEKGGWDDLTYWVFEKPKR